MSSIFTSDSGEPFDGSAPVGDLDSRQLAAAFTYFRPRLRQMVNLRLDRRLQSRVDPSDVLQEAFLDIVGRVARIKECGDATGRELPLFLLLRLNTLQKLLEFHRRHLGVQARDVRREVTLHKGPLPHASSATLAGYLLGQLTSPSNAAVQAERRLQLQEVLNTLTLLDREVLALRHFEELTNQEVAEVLGLSKSAASNRYVRALGRLRDALADIPGFFSQ